MKQFASELLCAALFVAFVPLSSFVPPEIRAAPGTVSYLQVDFPSVTSGFVTAQKGTAFWLEATRNGGSSWFPEQLPFSVAASPQAGPPSSASSSLEFLNKNLGWIAGYDANRCNADQPSEIDCPTSVFATADAGKTWTPVLTVPDGQSIDSLQLISQTVGWVISSSCELVDNQPVCGYEQTIHETVDGGKTWQTKAWHSGYVSQLLWTSRSTGWMATGPGPGVTKCSSGLFRTRNGGAKWTRVLNLAKQCEMMATFDSAKDGLVMTASKVGCDSGGCPEQIRRTTDGGVSWVNEAQPSSWTGTEGFVETSGLVDSTHGFLGFALGKNLRTEGGLATTSNGGKTWRRAYPCYSVGPAGASAPNAKVLWFAGSWVSYCSQARGTGLFESTDWGHKWRQITTGL